MASELKVALGVVVADVFHHLADARHLSCRQFSVLHITPYKVAEDATEILMTRIAEE